MTDEQVLAKGRPASAERRAAIIKIAHAAFLEGGYAATSMSSIAAEVGGSKATLYSYFPSKEDLFIAVVESKCEQIFSAVFEVGSSGGDFATALTQIGSRFVRSVLGDESIATYRLVTAEAVRFPEIGRALYSSGIQRGIGHLAGYLESAVADGVLRRADMRVAAEQFFDLCKTSMHHRRLWGIMGEPTEDEIAAQVEKAVTTFMAAYSAGPRRP